MTNGILLLNKPAGPSSARALTPLKKVAGVRKIGHTGTLDPFASGLLVLMVNGATRLASWFSNLDKEYEAVIRFGEERDTLDPEGIVTARAEPPASETLTAVIPQFTGTIRQVPPAYSAVHIQGERAYTRARRGEHVEIPARTVQVHSLALTPLDAGRYLMIVRCGSGTYIRSLARDLARAAGSVASLEALNRVAVGPFRSEEASELLDHETVDSLPLLPIGPALKRIGPFAEVIAPPGQARLIEKGRELDSEPLRPTLREMEQNRTRGRSAAPVLIRSGEGRELALCEFSNNRWSYRVVFPQ